MDTIICQGCGEETCDTDTTLVGFCDICDKAFCHKCQATELIEDAGGVVCRDCASEDDD